MQKIEGNNDNSNSEKTCPFAISNKAKKIKFNNSDGTPCPFLNSLINKGELDPTKEWTKKEVSTVLSDNKLMSNTFSKIFIHILSYPNGYLWIPGIQYFPSIKKPTKFTVETMQTHNIIEHDGSISREDFHIGDNVRFSHDRFQLIFKYFKNRKSITLKELIQYIHYLYKKSIKENDKVLLEQKIILTTALLVENVNMFISLSKDGRLNLKKLENVFREESLDGVETNVINTQNFSINFVKSLYYWNMERFFN
jgi:hypothetical protein